ncbi:hypothetical protein Tco_1287815 [Tanacetum coccineum]
MCPRFILEFYSQYRVSYFDEGQMFIEFVIQNQFFSYSLEEFALILDVPCEGACVFTDRWRLDELAYYSKVCRIRHEEEIDVIEYQVLTHKIEPTLKPLEEVIRENVFCMGVIGIMFLHVFIIYFIVSHTPKDSTLPISWQNKWSSDEDITTTPSPTTTSSFLTPPNAPLKTTSTNQISSSQENISSYFHSKLQISPPSSHEPNSPPHLNPLLDNILDVPPRPLNPQPLQIHPSLDITLSLSPVTPLDHTHDTTSPPSPPQPQPPIMGHPLFYNYHNYHGSTNLFFTLRDEMNIMFAHLEYFLTTAITSHFPPPP